MEEKLLLYLVTGFFSVCRREEVGKGCVHTVVVMFHVCFLNLEMNGHLMEGRLALMIFHVVLTVTVCSFSSLRLIQTRLLDVQRTDWMISVVHPWLTESMLNLPKVLRECVSQKAEGFHRTYSFTE